MIRRDALKLLAAIAASPATAVRAGPVAEAFSTDGLYEIARAVARAPYKKRPVVPQPWRELNYFDYKSIRPNVRNSIWTGTNSPMQVDLFPPGLYFPSPVEVNLVEAGQSRQLPFDWNLFENSAAASGLPVDDRVGYAGLRLRTELEKPGLFQEYAVFQGASYFRVVGKGQVYGLSARGLAVGTAGPNGEEFPDFTRFWIERPEPGAKTHKIHALLESPSVTGLYHFTLTPGDDALVDVKATLFPRRALENVGITPLTSMFLFDETNRPGIDDYRLSVHDSDGLSIHNGQDEVLWRPLANPQVLQVSHFMDENPRGFGLMQRSRRFGAFGDIEGQFEKRPSLWITPHGNWGKGAVILVEIPSGQENFDNIVAFWKPADALAPEQEYQFDYAMAWSLNPAQTKPVAAVTQTMFGRATDNPEKNVVSWVEDAVSPRREHLEFRIDFAPHPSLPSDLQTLFPFVGTNRGKLSKGVVQTNPETGGPRLAFSFDPAGARYAELRAQLVLDGRALSEVWLYRWTA